MPKDFARLFLSQVVPAVDGATADLLSAVATPDLERCIPLADLALLTPQDQHRALHLAASIAACPIMLHVDGGGCAVVLAHADDRCRLSCRGKVVGQRLWMEKVGRLRFARGVCRKPSLGRRIDQHLGKWMGLGEPEPMIVAKRKRHIGKLEMLDGRNDIERRQFNDALRVVERKPMRNTRAAVKASNEKALVPELTH